MPKFSDDEDGADVMQFATENPLWHNNTTNGFENSFAMFFSIINVPNDKINSFVFASY